MRVIWVLTKNKYIVYSNIHHNIFGFSTSVTKLQKQMPATKKTASNNALDDHDVPETSIPTEFSDNDAEMKMMRNMRQRQIALLNLMTKIIMKTILGIVFPFKTWIYFIVLLVLLY